MSDLVPGISGGTVAYVLGIYEKLLLNIKQLFSIKDILRVDFVFLISLFFGVLSAVILGSHLFSYMLASEMLRPIILSFFFGSMVGAIVLVSKRINKWNIIELICVLLGITIVFFFAKLCFTSAQHKITTLSFVEYKVIIAGCLAIMAMLMPGMSGSSVLMVLGFYLPTLQAVNDFIHSFGKDRVALLYLANLSFGIFIGLTFFSRLLLFLFKKYEKVVLSLIIGMMFGSLYSLWPFWKCREYFNEVKDRLDLIPIHPTLPNIFSLQFISAFICFLVAYFLFSRKRLNTTQNFL